MRFSTLGARALIPAALAAVVLVGAQPASPAATPVAAATPLSSVIANAKHHLGDPWRAGATGPSAFDCSGLVYHAFRDAGQLTRIGGIRRSAYGYLDWFRDRGKASRTGGKPGDLVVYGGGSHIGIYLGDGKVISTLTSGVRVHGLHAVTASFTAFLHTGLSSTVSTASYSYVAIRYVTTATALRKGPSTAYARITSLAPGTRLGVIKSVWGTDGRKWHYVRTPAGQLGWVLALFTRR
ncbi:MAG TPA: NlpC/P60 family protein [Candidatus Limnocylindrales bacterium]|nr:NlpC/P60 family protein [Candidatus Limnocylindrales bacterium]